MNYIQRIYFRLWLLTRPRSVRRLVRKLPPWYTYMVKPTGQMAQIYSYSEDGTVTVDIFENNRQPFTSGIWAGGYRVFGYGPDDLEPVVKNN